MIAKRFPDKFAQEPEKPKVTNLTEAQFEVTKQVTTKVPPWSTGFQLTREKVQKVLTPPESDKPGIKISSLELAALRRATKVAGQN